MVHYILKCHKIYKMISVQKFVQFPQHNCLHLREAQLILVTDNVTFRLVRGQLVRDFQIETVCCWSVAVLWDSMWPQGLQHARLPHPSPPPQSKAVSLAICLVYKLHAFLFSLRYPDYLTSCLHIQHLELAFCLFNFRVPQMLIKKHFFGWHFASSMFLPLTVSPKYTRKFLRWKIRDPFSTILFT